MTTKDYLNQINRLDKMIQNKLSEIYRLKTMACSVTVSTDKEAVKTSSDKDKLGSTVSKIVDLEKDTDKLIDEFIKKRNDIISQIDNMENVDYYHVLSMRYVNQNTFEEIAQATNWSIRKIFTLHGRALQEFERLYGKEYLENVQ
jgi:predicted secreted protein